MTMKGVLSAVLPLFLATICVGFDMAHHHDYDDMMAVMKKTNEKCPDITHLYDLPGDPSKTWEGRNLAVIIMSENPKNHTAGECADFVDVPGYVFLLGASAPAAGLRLAGDGLEPRRTRAHFGDVPASWVGRPTPSISLRV